MRALTVLIFMMAAPKFLGAQAITASLAVGAAVPTGGLGAFRDPGPSVRGALSLGGPGRLAKLRLEAELSRMPGHVGSAVPNPTRQGTLEAAGTYASLLVGRTSGAVAPYGIVGAGAQRLWIEGVRNPYGLTGAVRLGAGVQWQTTHARLFLEAGPHITLTDHGAGEEVPGIYWPVMVGVSF